MKILHQLKACVFILSVHDHMISPLQPLDFSIYSEKSILLAHLVASPWYDDTQQCFHFQYY